MSSDDNPLKDPNRVEVVSGKPPRPYVVKSYINGNLVDERGFGTEDDAKSYQERISEDISEAVKPSSRPKRPTDVVGNAIRVAQIATGEAEEEFEDGPEPAPKNPAAVEMGKLGGRKRAESMTPERRAEIARKAAESRWKKPAE